MSARPQHGIQILAARAALGMRRADLAQAAGLHPNSILRAEKQATIPRHSAAADRIGDAFAAYGVSFESSAGKAIIALPTRQ
jgi:DNA-binding XRE family transcriptional regulator